MDESKQFEVVEGGKSEEHRPISVLLLDDREENLLVRSTILRQKGYHIVTAASIQEAESKLNDIDIAVLDYHLGAGKFGTEVAQTLRVQASRGAGHHSCRQRSSASSAASPTCICSREAVRWTTWCRRCAASRRSGAGRPVVVDSRDFYYSRIIMAMSDDMVIEILDRDGNWQYVNDYFAALSHQRRAWYPGRNIFDHFPEMRDEWGEIIRTVADTRETYIDRRNHRAMPHLPGRVAALAVECAGLPHQTARRARWRGAERAADRTKVELLRSSSRSVFQSRMSG